MVGVGGRDLAESALPSFSVRTAESGFAARMTPSQRPDDRPAIHFEGVGFSYGRVLALRDVTFSVDQGEFVYLVGPSAAGKTTLLKLIHRQLRPQAGRLLVDGLDLTRARGRTIRRIRRRVGVVFQDYRLLERLTALENVAYALRVADLWLPRREAFRRAAAALRDVGLEERAKAFPRQLSGGQQQRLAIARAVAGRPAILLADEPTTSLDDANAENVMMLLRRVSRSGATVLIATHDPGLVTGSRQRVLSLARGELVRDRVLATAGSAEKPGRRQGARSAARSAAR